MKALGIDPRPGGAIHLDLPRIGPAGYGVVEHWRRGAGGLYRLAVVGGPNLVVNVGLDLRQSVFFGATAKPTLYLGLKGTGTPVVGDTMASHASWSEVTDYTEANRVTLGGAAGATGVWSNSASVAVFTINATVTVAGIFVTTVNTKGGTTGTLFAATNFAASRSLVATDELRVTYTHTAS
ncbi:MAG: hypothetical protein LC798_13770 [Chloroflexi bacterium]|nr:hypothetical protein [Chloroflexota bacterium]